MVSGRRRTGRPPTANEIVKLLHGADKSGVVNLAGLPAGDRQSFLKDLTPKLSDLRARLGHPHWVTVDETHHLLPANDAATESIPLGNGESVLHITESPRLVAREVLDATSLFIAIGARGQSLLEEFCEVSGVTPPARQVAALDATAALVWRPKLPDAQPFRLNTVARQKDEAGA